MPTTLREFLHEHDAACPSCGYSLRGLTIDVCPECEEHLVLGVQLAEPKLKAYIATVLGLAVGGGFSAMLVGYVCVDRFARSRASVPPDFLQAVVPGLVVCGVPLVLLLIKRRTFCRWGELARGSCAVVAWLLAAGNLVYFTAFVR